MGQNKAAALAKRYSAAFGIEILTVEKFLETADDLRGLYEKNEGDTLILGAVDNHFARALVYDCFLSHQAKALKNRLFWVDAGNETMHGQVVLSVVGKGMGDKWMNIRSGEIPLTLLPGFFDIFPEVYPIEKPKDMGMDCAIMVQKDPQTIQANMMSAFCATSLAIQALEGEIRTMALYFDALTGNTKGTMLTHRNLAQVNGKLVENRAQIHAVATKAWAKTILPFTYSVLKDYAQTETN